MVIETERPIVRHFKDDDIDLIIDINNDPECIKFNSWDSMSLEKCKEVLDKWISNYNQMHETGAFCIESKEYKSKVGMAFIVQHKEDNHYEIGFRLRTMHWNKGFAKEITRGFIKYAEDYLKAHIIIAEVYKANIRSRSIFEKLNFISMEHPAGYDGLIYKYEIVNDTKYKYETKN